MTPKQQFDSWQALAFESWALWAEANTVIGLRLIRLAGGGKLAEREGSRMIAEKITANAELGLDLLLSGPHTPDQAATKIVRHYRGKVSANRRRLAG